VGDLGDLEEHSIRPKVLKGGQIGSLLAKAGFLKVLARGPLVGSRLYKVERRQKVV
jgi:hypothetical protein